MVTEFEMKQLKDRVSVAMSACDSANKLKVNMYICGSCMIDGQIDRIECDGVLHVFMYIVLG